MQITITGNPKEIAAFIITLQERAAEVEIPLRTTIDENVIYEAIHGD